MNQEQLRHRVAKAAEASQVPGVAVGVHHHGRQHFGCHGVTSVEHPLPIDEHTLFAIGSRGKTYVATAIMCLVERGSVDLHEQVRTYVPELRLEDERVAERITVLNLLNHTAGFEGDVMVDTGEGDDALARYVDTLADVPQTSPLGGPPSYNNAALALAGRVIEKVTGRTYERAIEELLLAPLGLEHTLLSLNDIMTRRFAAGHQQHEDGAITVHRPWSVPRAETPMGGRIASSIIDQLAWARFHLGDGRAPDGTPVLSKPLLQQMQEPTSEHEFMPGIRLGIAWMLRDLGGVGVVGHGGDVSGQSTELWMVPEHDYAVAVLTNGIPGGQALREELARWAVEAYLGIAVRDPEPLDLSDEELAPYAGSYRTEELDLRVTVAHNRLLFTDVSAGDEHAPPFYVGLIGDERYLILDGPYKGMQGYFVRDASGAATALHIGRLAIRA